MTSIRFWRSSLPGLFGGGKEHVGGIDRCSAGSFVRCCYSTASCFAPTANCVHRLSGSTPNCIPRPHTSAAHRMSSKAGIHNSPEALPVSYLPSKQQSWFRRTKARPGCRHLVCLDLEWGLICPVYCSETCFALSSIPRTLTSGALRYPRFLCGLVGVNIA